MIGIVGAWLQGSRLRLTAARRARVHPVLPQHAAAGAALFLLLRLGSLSDASRATPGSPSRSSRNVAWAVVSLSFFAGAFNVEIFRSGIEAVPRTTVEAAESLGFSRLQGLPVSSCLPLAFRISLPALNNNLVNLVKTTTLAYAIAVPEMLYVPSQIWSDELNVPEMMNVLLLLLRAGRRPRLRDAPVGARDARAGIRP